MKSLDESVKAVMAGDQLDEAAPRAYMWALRKLLKDPRDISFDTFGDRWIVRIRLVHKSVGTTFVFELPKNNKTRKELKAYLDAYLDEVENEQR